MDNDFRKRVASPLLMLLGVLALIGLFLFSVSRVLLAVPEAAATLLALVLAGYVLLVAGLVGKYRHRVSARALGAGLAIGLVGLLAAGVVAAQAGMRELHPPEIDAPAEVDEEIPEGAFVWEAYDLGFTDPPETLPAGEEIIVAIDNVGALPHDVTIDGEFQVVAAGGEQDWTTVTLEPGEYYYYCSVPGHEPEMNGTVVVE